MLLVLSVETFLGLDYGLDVEIDWIGSRALSSLKTTFPRRVHRDQFCPSPFKVFCKVLRPNMLQYGREIHATISHLVRAIFSAGLRFSTIIP